MVMKTDLPRAIMVQGTSSNSGKTLLATALCRIFTNLGHKVMPFKAQNMTAFAHALPSGKLMSGAQALQAWAAKQTPDERMNPVLLMPHSDTGSEVLLLGESRGRMEFRQYMEFKKEAWEVVTRAYAELAEDADLMIIEGAGSPAEINLRDTDIVNMRMARHAGASVLLISDIDRGGAFAHLLGTFSLMEPPEQRLFAGFVLNRFRGDASLLQSAEDEITRRTGVPFVGTIPFLKNVDLPEEDSLSMAQNVGGASSLPDKSDALEPALERLAAHVYEYLDKALLNTLAC